MSDFRDGNGGQEEMADENELTPEERMAFQRLPRAAKPSDLLEERVVRSLKEEGILGVNEGEAWSVGRGSGVPVRTRVWFRPWMAGAAVAASLVLFASGIFLGQWLGARSTTSAFLAVREQDAAQLAMTIQEAGSAYVSALAALSQMHAEGSGAGGPGGRPQFSSAEMQQGREVALGALYGAAFELARISRDDPDVLRVLQILEDRRNREDGLSGPARNLVWF